MRPDARLAHVEYTPTPGRDRVRSSSPSAQSRSQRTRNLTASLTSVGADALGCPAVGVMCWRVGDWAAGRPAARVRFLCRLPGLLDLAGCVDEAVGVGVRLRGPLAQVKLPIFCGYSPRQRPSAAPGHPRLAEPAHRCAELPAQAMQACLGGSRRSGRHAYSRPPAACVCRAKFTRCCHCRRNTPSAEAKVPS